MASVPEPGFVIGLGALAATSLSMRRRRRSPSQSA
ncbi:MAG: PEP-CTERM sorting domain-containing protein [Leptolyngbyaceae cyanobacterium]